MKPTSDLSSHHIGSVQRLKDSTLCDAEESGSFVSMHRVVMEENTTLHVDKVIRPTGFRDSHPVTKSTSWSSLHTDEVIKLQGPGVPTPF